MGQDELRAFPISHSHHAVAVIRQVVIETDIRVLTVNTEFFLRRDVDSGPGD
jgi:hypothetical protein